MSDSMNIVSDMLIMKAAAVNVPRVVMATGFASNFFSSFVKIDNGFFAEDEAALMTQFEDILDEDTPFSIPAAIKQAKETSEGFITFGDSDHGLPLTDDLAALCRNAFAPVVETSLDAAIALLQKSDLGRHFVAFVAREHITIEKQAFVADAMIDAANNRIILPFSLGSEDMALAIARCVRAFEMQPVMAHLKNPDSAILLNRALRAELSCAPIHVAWELNLAGSSAAWTKISQGADADLAYAFGHRASDDFRSLYNGKAAIAAFDQWFYSGRTRAADRALIQVLLASSKDIANAEFKNSHKDTLDALRIIGARGTSRNFLSDHFMTLIEDGFYGEVRDRPNANFLWFVKFERSFRSAEERVEKSRESAKSAQGQGARILQFPVLKVPNKKKYTKKGAAIVALELKRL